MILVTVLKIDNHTPIILISNHNNENKDHKFETNDTKNKQTKNRDNDNYYSNQYILTIVLRFCYC